MGAFFLTFLLEYLRPVLPGAERYLIYGVVALLLYRFQPKGLYAIVMGGFRAAKKGGVMTCPRDPQFGQAFRWA